MKDTSRIRTRTDAECPQDPCHASYQKMEYPWISAEGHNNFPLLDEIVNSDMNIRQKPFTEKKLQEYACEALCPEDTIYAIIYTPMDCPRCEVKVRMFPGLLKSNNKNNKVALITVYPDTDAAQSYNIQKGYDKLYDNIIYDGNDIHSEIFSYSIGELNIVYFIKINGKGELIVGGDPLYINDTFRDELESCTKKMATADYSESKEMAGKIKPTDGKNLIVSNTYSLPKDWAISEIMYNPVYFNGYLFFNDKLDNSVFGYRRNGGRFETHLKFKSDSIENDMFVDLPDKVYDNCKSSGNFFYLANAPTILTDSIIGISYSIPKAYVEKIDSVGNLILAFYNTPVCIRRNFVTGAKLPLVHFDENGYKYFNHHFSFVGNNNVYIMGTQKGTWPIWEMDSDKINTSDDPFSDKFYTDSTYYMVEFGSMGQQENMFGIYGNAISDTFTGTLLPKPVACIDGEYLYYSDGVTGEINKSKLSDVSTQTEKFNIYSIDENRLPKPDNTRFYTYRYVDIYRPFFNMNIIEIKASRDKVYCLIRHGDPINRDTTDEYSVISYDMRTKQTEELWFPSNIQKDIIAYGVGEEDDNIVPFTISKNPENCVMTSYSLNINKNENINEKN